MRGQAACQEKSHRRRLGTSWARYEVRPWTLQAESLAQHVHTDAHKIAVAAFLKPDAPVRIILQGSIEDDQLLAGAVPQPSDWLRAWRAARSREAWKAAAETARTEDFIVGIRDCGVQARALQRMAEIIREVVRQQKRTWILESSSIFLGLDDRNGYKLVRFKCDVPAAKLLEGPCTRSGILGCVQCLKGATLEELAEDYSSRTADEVMKVVGAFCRPLGETRDDAVYDKIVSATKGIVADKALQKAGHMLKLKYLPNVRVLLRDPAHMIRLACKEPLHRTGRFEEQYKRLFSDQHALFKAARACAGLLALSLQVSQALSCLVPCLRGCPASL